MLHCLPLSQPLWLIKEGLVFPPSLGTKHLRPDHPVALQEQRDVLSDILGRKVGRKLPPSKYSNQLGMFVHRAAHLQVLLLCRLFCSKDIASLISAFLFNLSKDAFNLLLTWSPFKFLTSPLNVHLKCLQTSYGLLVEHFKHIAQVLILLRISINVFHAVYYSFSVPFPQSCRDVSLLA